MVVVLHQEELAQIKDALGRRPNGLRVLRMLREALLYPDSRVIKGFMKAGAFSTKSAVLAVAALLLILALANMPQAWSAKAVAPEIAEVDPVQASMQPTPQESDYQAWLHVQHERTAQQGSATPLPSTF